MAQHRVGDRVVTNNRELGTVVGVELGAGKRGGSKFEVEIIKGIPTEFYWEYQLTSREPDHG